MFENMFKKKPPTVESLMKKCNEEYQVFVSYLSKAHYESYLNNLTLKNEDSYNTYT